MTTNTILTALISAITGGSLLKLLELYLKRNRYKVDDRKEITDEWRDDYEKLEKRLDIVEAKLEVKTQEYEVLRIAFDQYKLSVWQLALEHNLDREFIAAIKAIGE